MSKELIKIKFNLEGIDKYGGSNTKNISDSHLCEIKITETQEIQLKVYFDPKEKLGEKIGWWHSKSDENFLKYIEVIDILKPDTLEIVDFSNSKFLKISSGFYEDELEYFIINIDSIKLVSKTKNNDDSEFYLNRASYKLIEAIYKYSSDYMFENSKYKWEPIKKKEDPIKFHKISFTPEHNFYVSNKNVDREVLIKKEPRFRVINEDFPESLIKEHVMLICDLFSFYSQENIGYFVSRIHSNGKFYYEILNPSKNESNYPHGMFRWDLGSNPLNLILNVDAEHLLKNREFISKIISRFIYSLNTNGEARFMILYNILEQVRNKFISSNNDNSKKIKNEYRFICGRDKTNRHIKDALKQIVPIVDEEDKALFEKEIHGKVNLIKYTSQKNQLESFFSSKSINPSEFELDFQCVKNLRDVIFHGDTLRCEDQDYLNKINYYKRFPKFVGTVMLKYFGIDDLKNIELERHY